MPSIYSSARRCLRCLLLVMCTYPFAKKSLTLHLARGEGRERYFGCNLMQRKVLASSHQHLVAKAPHRTGFELSGSVRIFGHNETLMKRTNCFNFSHCLIRSSKTTDLIYRHGRDSVLFAVEAYYRANMPV